MQNRYGSWLFFVVLFLVPAASFAMATVSGDGAVECVPWDASTGAVVGDARYDALERNYRVRQVVFPSVATGVQLAGELTLPRDAIPKAGLVLVTGSGPQDRDETVEGRKPFLVLSDALTRAGYAVLRFDDRGVGESAGDYKSATIPDFANDAAGAAGFLRSVLGDEAGPVGIIGHSEGGLVALQAAKRTNVDFSWSCWQLPSRHSPTSYSTRREAACSKKVKRQPLQRRRQPHFAMPFDSLAIRMTLKQPGLPPGSD